MKKLLSLLGSVAMVGTAGATVVACGNGKASETVPEVSLQELVDLINKAEKLIANAVNKNAQAEANLRVSIADAQQVVDTANVDQEVISAAIRTLNAAIEKFQNATNTDYSQLEALIKEAQKAIDNKQNANDEAEKTLTQAIETAQKIITENNSSQSKVNNEAIPNLERAIKAFIEATTTDYSELVLTIKKANDVKANPKNANQEAEKALAEEINVAQAIVDEAKANKEEVQAAVKKLENAIKAFEEATATDKTKLVAMIETAEKAVDENDNPNANKEPLRALIKFAETVINNPEATQEEVDTVLLKLEAALEVFKKEQEIQTDYSTLDQSIQKAHEAINNNPNPNKEEQDKLQKIIDLAESMLKEHNSSQVVVNEQVKLLNDGVKKFQEATKTVYEKLAATIDSAVKAIDESKNYNQAAENVLKTAIVLAQQILNNKTTSQKQVDKAVESLNKAIEVFKEATATDYSQLEVSIEYAQKMFEKYKNNPNAEIERFENIIQTARDLVKDKDATQAKVDEINEILKYETEYFVHTPRTNYKVLLATINEANQAIINNENPNANILKLEVAIRNAEAVANNEKATQKEVNNAVESLKEEIEKFINTKLTDYSQLNAAIEEANVAIKENENPNADVDRLEMAIKRATEMTNSSVPQALVDLELHHLQLEIRFFIGTPLTEFEELNNLIEEATAVVESGKYPNGKELELRETISSAERVAANSKASQKEVDETTAILKEALDQFKNSPKTDFSKMKEKIAEAKKLLDETKHIKPKARKDLEDAVEAAEKILSENPSQRSVDTAVMLLNLMITAFRETPHAEPFRSLQP